MNLRRIPPDEVMDMIRKGKVGRAGKGDVTQVKFISKLLGIAA